MAKDADQKLREYLAEHDVPCPACGYNLRGLGTDACPECGKALTLEQLSFDTPDRVENRQDNLLVGAVLLFSLAMLTWLPLYPWSQFNIAYFDEDWLWTVVPWAIPGGLVAAGIVLLVKRYKLGVRARERER